MLTLIIGAVMISFSAVFVKLAHVAPGVSALYRVLFGGAILLAVALLRRERFWYGWRAAATIVLAAFFFALDLAFWHRSIAYLGPGIGTLLPNFQVFVLAAAGVLLFGERWRWQFAVALPLAMAGLFMLVGADWESLPPTYHVGVWLGLATAACYAGYILSVRWSRTGARQASDFVNMALISLACAAMLAAVIGAENESFAIPSWRDTGILIAYGLSSQAVGWILISRSLNGCAPRRLA